MGCTSSKQARRDSRGEGSLPFSRSYSLPFRRPSKRFDAGAGAGGRQHVVSLTSSTLGTLRLDRPGDNEAATSLPAMHEDGVEDGGGVEAMTKSLNDKWLDVGEGRKRRGPKTPTVTPPNEPETINAWELMAGLEDVSPIRPLPLAAAVERSFSFPAAEPPPLDVAAEGVLREPADRVKVRDFSGIKEHNNTVEERNGSAARTSLVKARIHAFQENINARRAIANASRVAAVATQPRKCPPQGEGKVVLYFTSLRGVRKTYEDCCQVLVILRGYGVRIDERDVSMHGGFKDELYGILGDVSGGLKLPGAFADGRYLGGAEEIRQMHETGDLLEALKGCAVPLPIKGGMTTCKACGDVRFVPCEVCSGSCKVFVEDVEEEEDGGTVGFRRCRVCNENGLVRCPVCCAD